MFNAADSFIWIFFTACGIAAGLAVNHRALGGLYLDAATGSGLYLDSTTCSGRWLH